LFEAHSEKSTKTGSKCHFFPYNQFQSKVAQSRGNFYFSLILTPKFMIPNSYEIDS